MVPRAPPLHSGIPPQLAGNMLAIDPPWSLLASGMAREISRRNA
jgi:hypothetical protein